MAVPEDDLELKMLLDERGSETLRRLHRLARRGYVAKLGRSDVEDAIFLKHLGNGPDLILYGDGKLVAINDSASLDPTAGDESRIYNEGNADAAKFDKWLRMIKEPTWRQRTRPWREQNLYLPGCVVLLTLSVILASNLIEEAWKELWGR
jgi:hypothetical protein